MAKKKAKAKGKARRPSPIIAERLARCRREMKKKRVKAYLVSNPQDYFYLIGFTGEDSAILVTPRDVHVISDGRFDEAINIECPWTKRWMRKGLLDAEIATVAKTLKLKSMAVQQDHMTVADHDSIRKLNK